MDLTDNLKLPYPGPDDQGATALYLEALARQADAMVGAYEDELNDFLKPPTIVNLRSTTTTVDAGYEAYIAGWNSSGGTVLSSVNWPASPAYGDVTRSGWWYIGAADINTTIAGSFNNWGMYFVLEATTTDLVPGKTTTLLRETRVYLDSNTNGEWAEISGTFYAPPGCRVSCGLRLYHAMSADRVEQAGTLLWRHYLGSGDAAQKAGF